MGGRDKQERERERVQRGRRIKNQESGTVSKGASMKEERGETCS